MNETLLFSNAQRTPSMPPLSSLWVVHAQLRARGPWIHVEPLQPRCRQKMQNKIRQHSHTWHNWYHKWSRGPSDSSLTFQIVTSHDLHQGKHLTQLLTLHPVRFACGSLIWETDRKKVRPSLVLKAAWQMTHQISNSWIHKSNWSGANSSTKMHQSRACQKYRHISSRRTPPLKPSLTFGHSIYVGCQHSSRLK